MAGIHVNFTDDEASSESRSFEALPTGEYLCAITKVEQKEVSQGKNQGKPYYNVELTVQEGKHENRKMWGGVMLFDGALYSLAQLMKALGLTPGKDAVPSIEFLTGKQVRVNTLKEKNEYKMKDLPPGSEIIYQTSVKGYLPVNGAVTSSGASQNSAAASSGGNPLP